MSLSKDIGIPDERAAKRKKEFMNMEMKDPRHRLRELVHTQAKDRRQERFLEHRRMVSEEGSSTLVDRIKMLVDMDMPALKEIIGEIWSLVKSKIEKVEMNISLVKSELAEVIDTLDASWSIWKPSSLNLPLNSAPSEKISGANSLVLSYMLLLINEKLDDVIRPGNLEEEKTGEDGNRGRHKLEDHDSKIDLDMFDSILHNPMRFKNGVAVLHRDGIYEKVDVFCQWRWSRARGCYRAWYFIMDDKKKINYVDYYKDNSVDLVHGRRNITRALRKARRDG
jgi:hypothetical protein